MLNVKVLGSGGANCKQLEQAVQRVAGAIGVAIEVEKVTDYTAWQTTRDIVGKVWPFIVVGIGIGAGIHGFVPQDALAGILGREAWWSVPAGVLLGVPLYSNAAGIAPVAQALVSKGAALGAVLAFMMAVVGLSLPEMIILRRVLKPRLLATFVAVVATGIIFTGYLFNWVLR